MPISREELHSRFFAKRELTPTERNNITELEELFLTVAETLVDMLPEGRALSVALTELENAKMWATKAAVQKVN